MKSVRRTALDILSRIERGNAYAAPLLARAAPDFQPRDRHLLVELVYGVLRWRLTLDWIITQISSYSPPRIDTPILNLLRLGVYQLIYLRKVPRYAAVFSSVEMAKSVRGEKAGGFVNAVLRRTGEMGEKSLDILPNEKTPNALSIRLSHPLWLVKRWINRFGYEDTEALCQANNQPPPAILRVNANNLTRDAFIELAKREPELAGVKIKPTKIAKNGIAINPLSAIFETDWLKKGLVTIQDEASQLVGEVVSPRDGEQILDACAGIGGKATQLLELTYNRLRLLCMDAIHWKLKQLRYSAKRLGFSPPPCVTAMADVPPLANQQIFDKVLLDAPCSNTGVLRRHPERKWQLEEKDIEQLSQLQKRLLSSVAKMVKEGGALIYSTCSLEREEGEDMISEFLDTHKEYEIDDCARFLGKNAVPAITNGMFRSFPHKGGMDGFFCARLIRRHK